MPASNARKNARRKLMETNMIAEASHINVNTVVNDAPVEKERCSADDATPGMELNSPAKTRFICFVGKLPDTAIVNSVNSHFHNLQPVSVRLPMDKLRGVCRGFAFVELSNYSQMKECLADYHRSVFDDGKSPACKINVELT